MPATLSYPGVYIEEVPSGVRTITGVATSITAFIGRTLRGRVDDPIRIQSFADYQREFGSLWTESTTSYAVQQYFLHGGADALVVRIHNGASPASLTLPAGADSLVLLASSEGAWGANLRASVDHQTKDADEPVPDANLFNLTVKEIDPDTNQTVASETFLNISRDTGSPRFVTKVLEQESTLVRVDETAAFPGARPDLTADPIGAPVSAAGGDDGSEVSDAEVLGDETLRTGLYALKKADLLNLLCIPPLTRETDVLLTTLATAAKFCQDNRAMLIADPQSSWTSVSAAESGVNSLRSSVGVDAAKNVAVYFPRLKMADPLKENRTEEFAPCGAVAGVHARTDAQRGVWKAPAGLEASLVGVRALSYKLTDGENGMLNPLGLNCLRTFPVYGKVAWGARTLAGADRLASEWKYIPVRRMALFIEESLYRGTQWAVFEPNDEPLWAQLRLNVGAFMQNLFRQGAFQGSAPKEAYFVKCDRETTTQNDINLGVVNLLVGFAPLKPAEFVVIKIQQMVGQVES